MSKHGDLARNGRPEKRSESDGRMKSPPPESSSGEPKSDCERTLEALRASPHCRRMITSGSTVVWMLSSPAQLAAVKRALERS
jgi:hypothetical protein